MQTTNIDQRRPLNGFHQRKAKSNDAARVQPNTRIPTRAELPEAPADLADQLDRWHDLTVAERAQSKLAAASTSKADQADADHRGKVREALAHGSDPAKVKNSSDSHTATAAAHAGYSIAARNERERLGITLGLELERVAPSLFAGVEERIEEPARVVRGSLTAVREAWLTYSNDFATRYWLSHVALNGGSLPAFHGATPLPPEVVAALAVLEDHISSVEKLRQDEAQVIAFRETDAAAAASFARQLS